MKVLTLSVLLGLGVFSGLAQANSFLVSVKWSNPETHEQSTTSCQISESGDIEITKRSVVGTDIRAERTVRAVDEKVFKEMKQLASALPEKISYAKRTAMCEVPSFKITVNSATRQLLLEELSTCKHHYALEGQAARELTNILQNLCAY